jgi:hypothetical protein
MLLAYVDFNRTRMTLVPKLQLGNPVDEAPASRDGKLELPVPNSQAGAWELATEQRFSFISDNPIRVIRVLGNCSCVALPPASMQCSRIFFAD